jgi:hypothetical protein
MQRIALHTRLAPGKEDDYSGDDSGIGLVWELPS